MRPTLSLFTRFAAVALLLHGGFAAATSSPTTPEPAPTAPVDEAAPPVPPSMLEFERAFGRVAETVFPSIVSITVFEADPTWSAEAHADRGEAWLEANREALLYPGFKPFRGGSGFVVDAESGLILTCHHNLLGRDGRLARAIDVEDQNDRHYLAQVVGVEPTINLGVLKIDTDVALVAADPVAPEATSVGHWAIAMGDPRGAERTYAPGIVSALPARQCYQGQLTRTYLQAALTVHPEAYGGPLVNLRGEVLGILTPTQERLLDDRIAPAYGTEFALPIDLALTVYESLKIKQSVRSPWFGFSVLPLSRETRARTDQPPRTGLFIDDVFDPSPATQHDIRVGDVLTHMDGHRLLAVADFQKWLYLLGIGAEVVLTVSRDGEKLIKRVTIEERPAEAVTE